MCCALADVPPQQRLSSVHALRAPQQPVQLGALLIRQCWEPRLFDGRALPREPHQPGRAFLPGQFLWCGCAPKAGPSKAKM
eukprot:1157752-Pelagomonas_calceolata.AAC.4